MSIFVPKNNNESSLGLSNRRWKEIYIATASLGDSYLIENESNQLVLSGTYFLAEEGISGSLTKLADNTSYLIEGENVSIVSESNGSITLNSFSKTFESKSDHFTGSVNYHYSVNTNSKQIDAELPIINSENAGREIRFKRKGSNDLVLNIFSTSADTIEDSSGPYTLSTDKQVVHLISDGTSNWEII